MVDPLATRIIKRWWWQRAWADCMAFAGYCLRSTWKLGMLLWLMLLLLAFAWRCFKGFVSFWSH